MQLYESTVRLHLKPGLASARLNRLSVPQLQLFFNTARDQGATARTVHLMRTVLSSALGRAMKEELVVRNVARLVDLPAWRRKDVQPWTSDQVRRFLVAAREDPFYLAFLLLTVYGLRRGEVLGLRWDDIDCERAEIHIRQQLERYNAALQLGPVKTDAGQRDLPLLPEVGNALALHRNSKIARNGPTSPPTAWCSPLATDSQSARQSAALLPPHLRHDRSPEDHVALSTENRTRWPRNIRLMP